MNPTVELIFTIAGALLVLLTVYGAVILQSESLHLHGDNTETRLRDELWIVSTKHEGPVQ